MANERYAEFTEETPKSFVQGLFEESATKKQALGTIRRLSDGREFVYAKMGATVAVAGKLYQSVVMDAANVANVTVANANVGDRALTITPVTVLTADAVANAFADGYVHVCAGAANGMAYKIKSHPALTANTANAFQLFDKLRNANVATATSKVTLTRHPCKDVIIHPSPPTGALAGVATFPVTANYYAWLQKKGPCPVEADGTLVAGEYAYASNAADGCVAPAPANAANIITNPELKYPVGRVIGADANDMWALIDLNL